MEVKIVMHVCDHFTLACHPVGFHESVFVQQAVLQGQANAQRVLTHVSVPNLERSNDCVDSTKLL